MRNGLGLRPWFGTFEALTMLSAPILMVIATLVAVPTSVVAQEPQHRRIDVHEHVGVTARLLTPTTDASGTAWIPQVTPMYGIHRPWRGWDVRLNGVVFVQVLHEPRDRHRTGGSGRQQMGSINWGSSWPGEMPMAGVLAFEQCSARNHGRFPAAVR
jgi:hypothetical protein